VSDETGKVVLIDDESPFGPVEATWERWTRGNPQALGWDDPITENPDLNATEIWEI
jgi:hypothetical protein